VQAGQHLVAFFPRDWQPGVGPRRAFVEVTKQWLATFYPDSSEP